MEVDATFEEQGDKGKGDVIDIDADDMKDGKRTKWQLPPSHHDLFSSCAQTRTKKFQSNSVDTNEAGANQGQGATGSEMRRTLNKNNHHADKESVSLEEIAAALAAPRIFKSTNVARAEICPIIHRARLMGTKGVAAKIREQFGYEISNTTFLYAEEAMYLLEIGKLDIQFGKVSLSMERARALFLHSKFHLPTDNPLKIKTCSIDEYLVYKHLSELGYRVRRRDSDSKIGLGSPSETVVKEAVEEMNVAFDSGGAGIDDHCEMELDEESGEFSERPATASDVKTPQQIPGPCPSSSLGCQRGIKRKFGERGSDQTPGSTTSSAKDMSDEDADEEFGFGCPSNTTEAFAGDTQTHFNPVSSSNYTVTEADSDVDFEEDAAVQMPGPSCRNGVYIEEVGQGYDGDIEEDIAASNQEPQPSTSSACFTDQSQGWVDLADSDNETEKSSLSIALRIFNKFVPNTTIQIGFPPPILLPENIPSKDTIYEFDLKSRESFRTDSDLEYYVDELSLNSSPTRLKDGCSYKSWKEWRQGTVTEARNVLSESLLGAQSKSNGNATLLNGVKEDPMDKLHLWGDGSNREPVLKKRQDEGWMGFNIPFEIYHPTTGFTKSKKRKVAPNFVVAVVRNDDVVPSFAACDPLVNSVPVLIALVSDEASILFMNPDRSPIPSLF